MGIYSCYKQSTQHAFGIQLPEYFTAFTQQSSILKLTCSGHRRWQAPVLLSSAHKGLGGGLELKSAWAALTFPFLSKQKHGVVASYFPWLAASRSPANISFCTCSIAGFYVSVDNCLLFFSFLSVSLSLFPSLFFFFLFFLCRRLVFNM